MIGLAGFFVDAATFFIAKDLLDFGFAQARVIASVVAITFTWVLNRTYTFETRRYRTLTAEYLVYFLSSSIGAAINLAAAWTVLGFDPSPHNILAYLVGTGAGLVSNYLLYSQVVFLAKGPIPSSVATTDRRRQDATSADRSPPG